MAFRPIAPSRPIRYYSLPPRLEAQLAAYCTASGETPASVVADAVAPHLDALVLYDDTAADAAVAASEAS